MLSSSPKNIEFPVALDRVVQHPLNARDPEPSSSQGHDPEVFREHLPGMECEAGVGYHQLKSAPVISVHRRVRSRVRLRVRLAGISNQVKDLGHEWIQFKSIIG